MDEEEPIMISDAAKQALHDALRRALASVAAEWPEIRADQVSVHIPAAAAVLHFGFELDTPANPTHDASK